MASDMGFRGGFVLGLLAVLISCDDASAQRRAVPAGPTESLTLDATIPSCEVHAATDAAASVRARSRDSAPATSEHPEPTSEATSAPAIWRDAAATLEAGGDVATQPASTSSPPDAAAPTGQAVGREPELTPPPSLDASPPGITVDGSETQDEYEEAGTVPAPDATSGSGAPPPAPLPVTQPPNAPAVTRNTQYFGVAERFNRYYTDPTWAPRRHIYVSPTGGGDGASADSPTTVVEALANIRAGDLVEFVIGEYAGCFELNASRSGSYEQPIVLYGQRTPSGELGVHMECCETGRRSCFNLEYADYVAIDGFEFVGGLYGFRAVGGFKTSEHAVGNAFLNNHGRESSADPFFTGGNDWFVVEGNIAERAGEEDGHGIYLSNGSDWNIVRFNELNDNWGSDFQVNADPILLCAEQGIPFDDPRCDGDAKDGLGDGVSEYLLVEGNYFHNGQAQGANFTSVRNSMVRNNVFAFYERHGVSFWQETENRRLGSSGNLIEHNLFIGNNDRELLQFMRHSDANVIRNNVMIGIEPGNSPAANTETILLAESHTADNNVRDGNFYVGGRLVSLDDDFNEVGSQAPNKLEFSRETFDAAWFGAFPLDQLGTIQDYRPAAEAPWVALGSVTDATPLDVEGRPRETPVTLGPLEPAAP